MTLEPRAHGRAKATLAAIEHLIRQDPDQRSFEQVLQLTARELGVRRDLRRQLRETVIEEGCPTLDRGRHGDLVRQQQQVLRELSLRIDTHQPQ